MYQIKEKPEDFIVNEKTSIKLENKGTYSIYLLKKNNYTTEKSIQKIREKLNISRKLIGYAGNKDKIAQTSQYISIKNAKFKSFKLKDIELNLQGYSNNPISLGDLEGNEFIIKVITNKIPKKTNKMINYFGEQRFSKNNEKIGKSIIKKDFKKAVELILQNNGEYEKKIKEHIIKQPNDYIGALRLIPIKILKIFVHSYQSYLWNILASKTDDKSKEMPLIGFGTKETKEIENILTQEGIKLRDFIIRPIPELSSEGSNRNLYVEIKKLDIKKIDKGYQLNFFLLKGGYATEAIKIIFA